MQKTIREPTRDAAAPFNPLAKHQLAQSVADALLFSTLHPLPPGARFAGAGIYAIYYRGSFHAYSKLIEQNRQNEYLVPIYIGKAIPAGGRKGGMDFESAQGYSLWNRLSEHADSIEQALNLNLRDFQCRLLVVDDIWIPLGESLLIDRFKPLWNLVVDGFGNHDPGSGRYQQKRSRWDALHPGRKWAEKVQPCVKSLSEIESEILDFFDS